MAQQLITASAEFHATAANVLTKRQRPVVKTTPSKGRKYKAVVVVMLHGGIDSFNLLVPHSGCTANGGKDMYAEYKAVRSNVALEKDVPLPI